VSLPSRDSSSLEKKSMPKFFEIPPLLLLQNVWVICTFYETMKLMVLTIS